MSYTIIPQSADVDNITIEKNVRGELQIKGGAVTDDLLNLNFFKHNIQIYKKYISNATSLLYGEVAQNTTRLFNSNGITLSKTFTYSGKTKNITFGAECKFAGRSTRVYFYKNGVKIYQANLTTSFVKHTIEIDATEGDIFTISGQCYLYGHSSYLYLKNKGIYGEEEETTYSEVGLE